MEIFQNFQFNVLRPSWLCHQRCCETFVGLMVNECVCVCVCTFILVTVLPSHPSPSTLPSYIILFFIHTVWSLSLCAVSHRRILEYLELASPVCLLFSEICCLNPEASILATEKIRGSKKKSTLNENVSSHPPPPLQSLPLWTIWFKEFWEACRCKKKIQINLFNSWIMTWI